MLRPKPNKSEGLAKRDVIPPEEFAAFDQFGEYPEFRPVDRDIETTEIQEAGVKCNEVMTKNPVCCLPGDTVSKLAQLMKSNDIGPIPIIDNEQSRKLVGIVTDRDLALKIVADGRNPKSTKAEEVMTRDVVSCLGEDDLQNVLDAMSEHKLRRIPVIDESSRIVGIIAQADVATRVDEPEETAAVVREISQPAA